MKDAINIIANVSHQIPWDGMIVLITFLINLSVGTFLISGLGTAFGRDEYRPLAKTGTIVAAIAVALALVLLTVHLEHPLSLMYLLYSPSLSSPITWGAVLLGLYLVNLVVYFVCLSREDSKAKTFAITGIGLALAVIAYQSFEFGIVEARALTNSVAMPVYFLISALLLGTAVLLLAGIIKNAPKETTNALGLALAGLIVAELFGAFFHIMVASNSDKEAQAAVGLLLSSPTFLGVGLFLGGIVPFAILFMPQARKTIAGQAVSALLVLVGVYAVRYSLIIIGQTVPLS